MGADTIICPWCGTAEGLEPVRMHDDGTEYICPECRMRHTRRPENPATAFALFPGDIYAAFRPNVPTILLD